MKDTTIVITAFDRPRLLRNCIESIRRFYPVIPIIVSDNGKTKFIVAGPHIKHMELPYDCGANRARRDGIAAAGTKYVVLIEDDMKFTRQTHLEAFYNVLDRDMGIGMIGGAVRTRGRLGAIGSLLNIDHKRGVFWRTRIDNPPDPLLVNGTNYFYCDYVRMFFMVRRDMEIDWEVGLYPSSGSHLSIMLKLLNSKLKKAWTWECEIEHGKSRPTREYAAIRTNYRAKARKIFVESMGLRYGIFNNGERCEDMLTGEKMSLMELSRRINGTIGMG